MKQDSRSQWRVEDLTGTGNEDPRVVAAVQEYLTALESGQPPERAEFLAQHAEIADLLSHCLDGLEMVHEAIQDLHGEPEVLPAEFVSGPEQRPLGDFHIVREIGRGGMGIVHEAVQLSLGRRVALKVLPFASAMNPAHLRRFQNEAHAAAQLHHTNIVPIYAVGSDRGVHFYAMQLIEGHSLSVLIGQLRHQAGKPARDDESESIESISELKLSRFTAPRVEQIPVASSKSGADPSVPPSPARPEVVDETKSQSSTVLTASGTSSQAYYRHVARLMQQAAAALEHAHSTGVVHRDIKPANLLLDLRGNIWITDFGLAHADAQLTRTGDLLGTLRYMSPEQAMGNRGVLDHRTDIYSLGVTFYELLTLEPAIVGDDRHGLLRQIFDDEPTPPRALVKDIPMSLETIVLKAIAKSPTERYATAQQFADDLERWLDDKPILARRPTLREHAARWCRRHRSVVRTSLVFMFLALFGLLASTILIYREHGKATRAYKRESVQRAAAEQSFEEAREAVDTFSQIGEEELANSPDMLQLRRKILQTSLEYYNSFLDQRHDDPSVQAELAATSERISRIVNELSILEAFAPLMLLSDALVQQDLSMTPRQRQQIDQILLQLRTDREQARADQSRLTPQQRQQQLAELLRSNQEKIVHVLTRDQIARLRQVAWQQRGPFAFRYPEVITALSLSSNQRQQISEIIEEERPIGGPDHRGPDHRGGGPGHHGPRSGGFDLDGQFAGGDHDAETPEGGGGPGGFRSMRGPFDRTVRRILDVLTPEQRTKWKDLIGDPFAQDLGLGPHDWLPR